MQQSDMNSSFYQSHFQNPNLADPPAHPLPPTHASAPPVSSTYSSSDYSNYYSATYPPPYPHNTDHLPNLPPTYPPNPNSQILVSNNTSYQPSPYYPYDQNQTALNYDYSNPNYDANNPNSSTSYSSASTLANYGNLYESGIDSRGNGAQGFGDDCSDGGVYPYQGGKVGDYGAHRPESSTALAFDDYGRPINFLNEKQNDSGKMIPKAVPKTETEQDVKSGVQKFRVKLLSESGGQSDMDVLCQIGLDGIRILDPTTSRTLKIYPLETMTRWEVLDSHIFAFWTLSSIDIEARRIRLKSNRYTTNNILDTVAAATIQLKEMGGSNKPSDSLEVSEQPSDKKKGFPDWMNLMKPGNEEKDHWVPDEVVTMCTACGTDFGAFVRKHHCRNCGEIFCDKCTQGRIALTADENAQPVRVCDRCMAEVTQRLSNAKEPAAKVVALHSHEDLAKKLQEEMDKNRKTSTGLKSHGSDMRTREVECPTCTVHLQVQIPASGSKTIECGVCQHPFLISAH